MIINIQATDICRFFHEMCDGWILFRVRTGLPVSVTLVLFMTIAQGDFVSLRESKELVPVYAVLSAWKPEGDQVAFFYPSQYGYLTHAAVPGYGSGCQVLGVEILNLVHQCFPPCGQRHLAVDVWFWRIIVNIKVMLFLTLFTPFTDFTIVLILL